jgi:S-adenosylmethionine decarboxylase proenzyme
MAMMETHPAREPARSRGLHWLLDLSDCACPPELLERAEFLRASCIEACRESGMQVVGERFHQFEPEGVTGVVLLSESHLAVHTWPELGFAALDIYVCDHSRENANKGERLSAAMQALFAARCASRYCLPRESVADRVKNQLSHA